VIIANIKLNFILEYKQSVTNPYAIKYLYYDNCDGIPLVCMSDNYNKEIKKLLILIIQLV